MEENLKPRINTRVKTPTVLQMEATECGAASLCMILGYYGAHIPLEQVRIDCGVSRDGCVAKNVLRAGRMHGMTAKGFSVSIEGLLKMKVPSIIHWEFDHFVVFEGVKGGYAYLNDPAMGRRKITMEELSDSFTGIVLTFEPGEGFQKTEKQSGFIDFAKRRISGQKKPLVALVLSGICLAVPGILIPVLSQIFVDDVIGEGKTDWISWILLAILGSALFQCIFMELRARILVRLQMKMSLISGYDFMQRMLRLPIAFFDQRYAGDLANRISHNDDANNFLTGQLAETALDIMTAVFYLILLLVISPVLALIGLAGVAANIGITMMLGQTLSSISTKTVQDESRMLGALYSGISLTETLKASGVENDYAQKVLGHFARYTESEQKLSVRQKMLGEAPEAITAVFSALVLLTGALLVVGGNLTAGSLLAFTELLTSFTTPVNKLVGFFQQIQTTKADIACIEDIEKYKYDKRYREKSAADAPTEKLSGKIEFKDVSFGYSKLAPPLIENFNFTLEPGKTIALVGASGSGKSTVAKLASGLYYPWGGEVLYDGMKTEEIPAEVIYGSVASVDQKITVFSGTVRDNLTLWNSLSMDSDMVKAAKDACIHDDITQLTDAYDHFLSEGGKNLSGGQRQRLEIARALMINPTVLILDEATAALDPIVEQKVMENIKARGCSCIIVAHRLSTIRDADEIIVMDRGKIVERGTHDELKNAGGLYSKLIKNV